MRRTSSCGELEVFFHAGIFLVPLISIIESSLMSTRNVLNRRGKVFVQKICFVLHFVKSIRIQRFSGPYFPTVGLNTEIKNSVNLCIQFKCRKERTIKIPNTETFVAVTTFTNIKDFLNLILRFP